MPIRVGVIGLKAVVQDAYTPGTWGLQHLKALDASPHYEVTAVCNQNVESAQKAIDIHKIANARAYGSAEDIARDPNVDMILVSVWCDKHYELMIPAIEHKKDIYVEFPVAPTPAEVNELAQLARQNGVKVAVGAQARADPAFRKVRDLITRGEIGDVVSSSMMGYIPVVTADGWPHAQREFLNKDSSISRARGVLGHVLELYTATLGHFKEVQSILKVQHKLGTTVDEQQNVVDAAYPTTAPDTMFVQGVLENGAVASLALRTARPGAVADGKGFRWVISGTKGEIEVVTGPGIIQFLPPSSTEIRLLKQGGEVQVVSLESEVDHIASLSSAGPSVARLWEAFATGDKEGYPTLEDSFKVHELLEKINGEGIWAP